MGDGNTPSLTTDERFEAKLAPQRPRQTPRTPRQAPWSLDKYFLKTLLGRSPGGLGVWFGPPGGQFGLETLIGGQAGRISPSTGLRSDPALLRLGPKMAKKFKGNHIILKKTSEILRIPKEIIVFNRKMVVFYEK